MWRKNEKVNSLYFQDHDDDDLSSNHIMVRRMMMMKMKQRILFIIINKSESVVKHLMEQLKLEEKIK